MLYAGSLPEELTQTDFSHLQKNRSKVTYVIGDQDPYLNAERKSLETIKIENVFQGKANELNFKGGHDVKKEIINDL